MGQPVAALQSYAKAVEYGAGSSMDLYLEAADVAMMLQDYDGVTAWCNAARTSFPNSYQPDFTQGLAALRLGYLDDADKLLKAAHDKAPTESYSLSYLGLVKQYQKNFLRAAQYYEEAATLNPKLPESCDWLRISGDLYSETADQAQAGRVYETGLKQCTSNGVFQDRLKNIGRSP